MAGFGCEAVQGAVDVDFRNRSGNLNDASQISDTSSVTKRLEELRVRAQVVRRASLEILAASLQVPTSKDGCERASRSGIEGRLHDICDFLDDAERSLRELGAYLFA